MFKRLKAEAFNTKALAHQEAGRLEEAVKLFQQAAATDPKWASPLYNLGLLYKRQRSWQQSLEFNQRATKIDRSNQGAWWNLGIAATALRNWDAARAAWRGFGIELPPGDGPIDLPCGFGPIRLNPDGDGEVVWAYRLDPARAELANIPFPESKFRWRDVVLNDGAPTGYRKYKGQDVPVFDALELFERSPFDTFVADVAMPPEHEHIVRLAEVAAAKEGCAEDWSTSVRILCKACSEGRPHAEHDTSAAPAPGVHIIGIAARSREHASDILHAWEQDVEAIHIESLSEART